MLMQGDAIQIPPHSALWCASRGTRWGEVVKVDRKDPNRILVRLGQATRVWLDATEVLEA